MSEMIFPEGFIWGTTTSAYQIEGGWRSDGKGESIWDRFTHIPGNILNNDNGDVACDHYRLYKEDVDLLRELGVKSYNFSISWPRVFPDGTGKPNAKGMEFYRNLAELLVRNGITPKVTLYHWDLPQKLQDAGGWAVRKTAEYFEQYARYIFRELGDLVPLWVTFNEPWVSAFVGHWYGGHPPGIKDPAVALQAAHNTLLAHGLTVRAFREMEMKGEIGIALNLNPIYPATEDERDAEAAERYGEFYNGWFVDPILKGKYPERLEKWLSGKGIALPETESGDMKVISAPIDFLGVNNYTISCAIHNPAAQPLEVSFMSTGKDRTDSGWEIYPEGIYDLLTYLHREYNGIKMIVTENGASFKDVLSNDGKVEDDERVRFLYSYIARVYRAVKEGVNVAGYYLWSFLDNFEWNLGYSKRFGLVYVDYATKKRTIKKSGYWYKKVIKSNGLAD